MTDHHQLTHTIATVLKKERKQKGWSLDKTAQATGVSKAMLGQIERQESSPTIATLWKIATGLNCSFSSFIVSGNNVAEGAAPFSGDNGFSHDPNMKVKTLFSWSPVSRIETFEITLLNKHEQLSTPHQPGVLEHIHVVSGGIEVLQGEQWYEVKAGEQFLLHADLPHGYRDHIGKSIFIDVIYYPPLS